MLDTVKSQSTVIDEGFRSLADRWEEFRHANPKTRIREAARQMGVTELELVATGCGQCNTRLRPEWSSLIGKLDSLGSVLAITRNDAVVHETHGCYGDMRQRGSVGMYFTPGIDTRFFFDRWKSVFAVNENGRLSLQFFDRFGVAAHKVYITERSDLVAYEKLVASYRSPNQGRAESVFVSGIRLNESVEVNSTALREAWLAIKDVHEGPRIVRAHGGDYDAVYSALGDDLARPLASWSAELLLQALSEQAIPSMIFVMNKSAVQSYAGPVNKVLRTGPWFNVLDPEFNLHLKTADIGRVWYVRKPSADGWVTTLHVFDRHGREIMLMADSRQRGMKELSPWRDVLWSIAEQNPVGL